MDIIRDCRVDDTRFLTLSMPDYIAESLQAPNLQDLQPRSTSMDETLRLSPSPDLIPEEDIRFMEGKDY